MIDGSSTSATAPEYSSAIYINVTDHFTYFITQLLLNRFVADCYYRSIISTAQLLFIPKPLLLFNYYHCLATIVAQLLNFFYCSLLSDMKFKILAIFYFVAYYIARLAAFDSHQ